MESLTKENIIKNIFLIIILLLLYFPISNFLINSDMVTDKASSGNILVAVSIIAVIACFANFEFSYDQIEIDKTPERIFSHVTTGLFMVIIGVSLIFTRFLISFVMGKFIIMDLTLILLYISCVFYDFFDILKAT